MLAWCSPFKIPQEAVIARKDIIHMNENNRWDFMAKSEFLPETILKEFAYGIAVAQMSENNYSLKVFWQVVAM